METWKQGSKIQILWEQSTKLILKLLESSKNKRQIFPNQWENITFKLRYYYYIIIINKILSIRKVR